MASLVIHSNYMVTDIFRVTGTVTVNAPSLKKKRTKWLAAVELPQSRRNARGAHEVLGTVLGGWGDGRIRYSTAAPPEQSDLAMQLPVSPPSPRPIALLQDEPWFTTEEFDGLVSVISAPVELPMANGSDWISALPSDVGIVFDSYLADCAEFGDVLLPPEDVDQLAQDQRFYPAVVARDVSGDALEFLSENTSPNMPRVEHAKRRRVDGECEVEVKAAAAVVAVTPPQTLLDAPVSSAVDIFGDIWVPTLNVVAPMDGLYKHDLGSFDQLAQEQAAWAQWTAWASSIWPTPNDQML